MFSQCKVMKLKEKTAINRNDTHLAESFAFSATFFIYNLHRVTNLLPQMTIDVVSSASDQSVF